jgi:hypothetical protein
LRQQGFSAMQGDSPDHDIVLNARVYEKNLIDTD